MAITTKPKPQTPPNEAAVQSLIDKGGSIATAGARQKKKDDDYVQVLLRLPRSMLAEIDARSKMRKPVKVSRNTWMIEAFYLRLENDADAEE